MAERSGNIRLPSAGILLAACALAALPARARDASHPARPVSVSSRVAARLLVKSPPPGYPPLARINFIQGRVRVRILVADSGRVTEAHILHGHPFLAMAALDAVRKWAYQPYRQGEQAVAFMTLVDFKFTLTSKKLERMPVTAERDLKAQVTPPEVAQRPADSPSAKHVHLRVLVDSEGHAADARRVSGRAADAEEAQRSVAQWTFQPARWGSMPVPWYLDVDVPVSHWAAHEDGGNPGAL